MSGGGSHDAGGHMTDSPRWRHDIKNNYFFFLLTVPPPMKYSPDVSVIFHLDLSVSLI